MDADIIYFLILKWSYSFPHLPRCPIAVTIDILHQKLNRTSVSGLHFPPSSWSQAYWGMKYRTSRVIFARSGFISANFGRFLPVLLQESRAAVRPFQDPTFEEGGPNDTRVRSKTTR
jgi:hypothetical protein